MDQVRPVEVSLPARSEVAFLSRTVCSSSTTKWILPARLRSPARNDIVFIGDNSIQLREFVTTSEAHLVDVTTKFTFRSLILAAGVISAPTEVEKVDVLEQIVNQTVEKERYVIGGKPLPDDYPAQILVLALASCELAFVYIQVGPNGSCSFQWARRPVLSGCDLPDKFCKTLAIDPDSRALAFAPSMGCVGIASLNSFEGIKSAIDDWQPSRPQSFLPWTEQRFIQVDGQVLKMDFLKSADEDPGKVILLLLVVNMGTTSILLYRWNTRMPLHQIKSVGCSGQVLAPEDRLPLMLIPCGGMASFFLVTERELVLYGQVTGSKVQRTPYPLPTQTTTERNLPPRPLLWSQWAKPSRYQDYRKTNEDIMLVREDGLLQYFMIQHKPKTRARSSTAAGHLHFDVNTAVCMIPVPRDIGGGDILIVGGSMCTGGVFHLPPRETPVLIQSLPNWAPFSDLLLLKPATINSADPSERRLIVCTGNRDGHGSVAEIHHGLEAQVGWSMEHSDSTSIEKIWTIEDETHSTLLLLFSHTLHTSLVLYKIESTDFESADAGTYPGLEFNSPTLSAARLGDDALVQITSSSINIFSFSNKFKPIKRDFILTRLLCAEIVVSLGVVICAYPSRSGLSLGTIDLREGSLDNDDLFTSALELDRQPISLHPAILGGSHLVFVSTEDGHVAAYRIEKDTLVLNPLFEFDMSKVFGPAEDVRVSSMCLLAYTSSPIGLLLCGLRSGYLVSVELKVQKKGLLTTHIRARQRIGSTTVFVSPDRTVMERSSPTAAFAICRSIVRYISLNNNAAGADWSNTPVFFVERGAPSKASPIINACSRIQELHSDPFNDIGNLLISATPENVLFSSLVPQPSGVVQTNPVQGTPKRVIHSAFLNQLLVGTDHPSGPIITFMEEVLIEEQTLDQQAKYKICQAIKVGEPNERIESIIAYRPTDGSRHFEFLVIALNATGMDPRSQAQTTTGKVVCLSLLRIKKKGASGSTNGTSSSPKPHLILRTPGKAITAMSISGESDLLIGTEKQLKQLTFDFEARQWTEASHFDLPSAIAAIDVNLGGGKILVATKKHSWMVFKISPDGHHLVLLESDRQARNLTCIQSFLGKRALVTSLSEKGTTVTCMREDVEQNGQMRVVCDATVPLFLERVVEETEGITTTRQGRQRSSFVGCSADGTVYRFLMLRKEEWDLLNVLQALYEQNKGSISGNSRNSRNSRNSSSNNSSNNSSSGHGTRNTNGSVNGKSKSTGPTLRPKQAATTVRKGKSSYSHIDGDALASLVGDGVMSLRNLLGENKIKTEVKEDEEEGVAAAAAAARRRTAAIRDEIADKLAELKKACFPLVSDSGVGTTDADATAAEPDDDNIVGAVILWLRQILNWEPM